MTNYVNMYGARQVGPAAHPPEDAFMIPGYGAQPVPPEKYVAGNDNVPERGQYIGQQIDDDLVTTTFAPLEKIVGNVMNSPLNGELPTSGGYVETTTSARTSYRNPRSVPFYDWPRAALASPSSSDTGRTGDWMQTYSGRKFWPLDPRPEEVHIEDIAHSLSLQCRYAGHCISFYSVAEHSVHVARWLLTKFGPLTALHGLLHDAPEAYVVDVPRPLKRHLDHYRAIEERVWRQAVAPRFGLAAIIPSAVHEADNRIIADELVLMRPMEWHARHDDPIGAPVAGWHPDAAEDEFLACYVMLERKLKEEGRR